MCFVFFEVVLQVFLLDGGHLGYFLDELAVLLEDVLLGLLECGLVDLHLDHPELLHQPVHLLLDLLLLLDYLLLQVEGGV